jgi:hypothetical protein
VAGCSECVNAFCSQSCELESSERFARGVVSSTPTPVGRIPQLDSYGQTCPLIPSGAPTMRTSAISRGLEIATDVDALRWLFLTFPNSMLAI